MNLSQNIKQLLNKLLYKLYCYKQMGLLTMHLRQIIVRENEYLQFENDSQRQAFFISLI